MTTNDLDRIIRDTSADDQASIDRLVRELMRRDKLNIDHDKWLDNLAFEVSSAVRHAALAYGLTDATASLTFETDTDDKMRFLVAVKSILRDEVTEAACTDFMFVADVLGHPKVNDALGEVLRERYDQLSAELHELKHGRRGRVDYGRYIWRPKYKAPAISPEKKQELDAFKSRFQAKLHRRLEAKLDKAPVSYTNEGVQDIAAMVAAALDCADEVEVSAEETDA